MAQGCVSASGIPGGPLPRGGGFTFNGALTAAAGYGKADVQFQDGHDGGTFADSSADHFLPLPLPTRIGGRVAPCSYFDIAADVSLNEIGAEARVGLPEGTNPLPLALAGGFRRGWESAYVSKFSTNFAYGRLEAYPLLWGSPKRSLHAVLTGGLSYGDRFHSVWLPRRFKVNGDSWGEPLVEVLRRETRVEATLGAFSRPVRQLPLGLFFMPYWVVNEPATVRQVHMNSGNLLLNRYQQDFGFIVAITVGYTKLFSE